MLKQFIDQLSSEMKLNEELVFNQDGSYTLSLDPGLPITMQESGEAGISLFARLAPVLDEKREDFLLKAMNANLFGRETGGAALGLDRDGKHATLLTFLPEKIGYREFHDSLEDFVNYADAWKSETTEMTKVEE